MDKTVTVKQEETSGHELQPGLDTSTVTLPVVGGDEKGCLESETVKYGHEFYRTRTRK
jgi:hypothetical protein